MKIGSVCRICESNTLKEDLPRPSLERISRRRDRETIPDPLLGELCGTRSFCILTRTVQQNDRGGSLVGVSTREKGKELIRDGGYRNSFKQF